MNDSDRVGVRMIIDDNIHDDGISGDSDIVMHVKMTKSKVMKFVQCKQFN